ARIDDPRGPGRITTLTLISPTRFRASVLFECPSRPSRDRRIPLMLRLTHLVVIAGTLAAASMFAPQTAQADDYWDGYWGWYDNDYTPRYHQHYGRGYRHFNNNYYWDNDYYHRDYRYRPRYNNRYYDRGYYNRRYYG